MENFKFVGVAEASRLRIDGFRRLHKTEIGACIPQSQDNSRAFARVRQRGRRRHTCNITPASLSYSYFRISSLN